MNDRAGKPNISLFFPVYNDEGTVRAVTEKAICVLSELCDKFEIVIVDDGSPDRAGEIADQLANEHPEVSVVHHEHNMGYGRALQSGFARARRYEWICFTDGDDQYDVGELRSIVNLLSRYDMVITFRYCKIYSTWRMFLSWIYNHIVRWLFRSPFRDIGCGLKIVRREVIDHIEVKSSSPFVGAEIVHRAMLKGYLIGEVGITTYPRELGQSTTTSWRNIMGTIRDMLRFHEEVYSNRTRPAKT